MAQSRVQKGKGKKSKFPMWGLAIVVVLVVAIAGYAIVNYSKAYESVRIYNNSKQNVRTTSNSGLKGGVGAVSKDPTLAQAREIGNIPVYTEYTANEFLVDVNNYATYDPPQACAKVYVVQNTRYLIKVKGTFYPGKTLASQPSKYETPTTTGWRTLCVDIPKAYYDQAMYALYATRQDVITRVTVSEDDPVSLNSFVAVQEIYVMRPTIVRAYYPAQVQ
jgi:hypothetical protein